ncbi:hypothetical protein E8D34_18245 [Nocardioides sp. GY 10113]|uniref:FHA domain-containing protein n=1 Tax=Nocardioides sp. GY 10113 TaxID=2569761 RepID=UPI0010A76064|nr:FHA domain-containing protein [Nocardioides sp. GY 10113]TIC81334.1 hypothetical protein E8D34_18245 [Nocardioides sp. GY 10113]
MALAVSADLALDLDVEGGATVHARLSGRGNRLDLEVDDPGAFAGGRDAPAVRALAEGLAAQGLVIRVVNDGRHLVSLGAVSAPWWQRRVTGSRRIRIGSIRGALTSARSRARGTGPVLPDTTLLPPTTLWPLAPTFQRRPRRRITTTHDPARGGSPRLLVSKEMVWPGDRQPIFWLTERVVLGSGPEADIRLPGLEPVHAVIEHDDRDEYVVTAVAGVTRVHGARVARTLLRTGARLEVGDHRLVYYREEYADHGRPYGGRIGGEAGHQQPQPPREAS